MIAEPKGVQAKSLKKDVLPEKSHSTRRILAIEPAPQNLGYRNYDGRCFALVSTYCPITVLTFIPGGLCDIIVPRISQLCWSLAYPLFAPNYQIDINSQINVE